MIKVIRLSGEALLPYLPAAARLRMEVFREFPYLYDGDEEYERNYLSSYAQSAECVIVLAIKNGGQVVGISTGLPLAHADPAFRKPFEAAGWDTSEIFYFGESVLAQSERGQGIGRAFFRERQNHAAALGYRVTTFCAVERPPDHPLKPNDYRGNEEWWTRLGYRKSPDLAAELEWRQVDTGPHESHNKLIFWIKQ